jgi:hypothetical protein
MRIVLAAAAAVAVVAAPVPVTTANINNPPACTPLYNRY